MPGHTEAVLQVSYSPDGSMLASGGGDMTVRRGQLLAHGSAFRFLLRHVNRVL